MTKKMAKPINAKVSKLPSIPAAAPPRPKCDRAAPSKAPPIKPPAIPFQGIPGLGGVTPGAGAAVGIGAGAAVGTTEGDLSPLVGRRRDGAGKEEDSAPCSEPVRGFGGWDALDPAEGIEIGADAVLGNTGVCSAFSRAGERVGMDSALAC